MTKRAEQFVTRVQFTTDELSRLLARRRRARLGCTALARQLGVTVTAMDNYERGIRRVPAALLPRWSRALALTERRGAQPVARLDAPRLADYLDPEYQDHDNLQPELAMYQHRSLLPPKAGRPILPAFVL